MKALLKQTMVDLRANWIVSVSFRFAVLLFLLSLTLLAWRWRSLPPLVPLWYSKPWGNEQLAHPLFLLLLPFGNLFWYVTDLAITAWQKNRYLVFTQALFLTTFLSSFLSFVTLVKILFLVT